MPHKRKPVILGSTGSLAPQVWDREQGGWRVGEFWETLLPCHVTPVRAMMVGERGRWETSRYAGSGLDKIQ